MIDWKEVIIRLLLAAFFGAVIGLERERKDWAAGLRTHMMVCLGAALSMIVSTYGFNDVLGKEGIGLDPSRVAAQVISGIGFIGAGTILFLRQGTIRGLTTASGLWTVAAIGLATGGGLYFAAAMTTILAIIILWILQPIERKFSSRFKQKSIKIITVNKDKSVEIVNSIFRLNNADITAFLLDKTEDEFVISFKFKKINKTELVQLIKDWQADTAIKEVVWG
ncbi:MgtC/SapB family protein [Ilyomonas limi]|uniref:MgtC/SapB family protein n=1 Tax=Ilyomonas limi TaxID=2575867 RepID=A0A4U3KY35_9BACT|nr:MgtC/SapB family protein [Ilyomonas limi]TKK67380.1 MgtC/SapB family protein [Ilyomonas limi]